MRFAHPKPPPSDERRGKLKNDQKRKQHDPAPTEGAKGRNMGAREKGGREGKPRVVTAKEKCKPQSTLPWRLFWKARKLQLLRRYFHTDKTMQHQKPLCFVKNVRNLAFDAVGWSIHTLHETHKTALNSALWFSRGNHSLLTSLCVKLSLLCGEEFVGKSRLAAWAQASTHVCTHTHTYLPHSHTYTETHISHTVSHTHTGIQSHTTF